MFGSPGNGTMSDEFNEADNPDRNPDARPFFTLKGPVRWSKPKRWKHEADTRRGLALGIVGSTIVLYAALVGAVILGTLNVDDAVKLVAALSPLQSLAAATVGFFYARRNQSR